MRGERLGVVLGLLGLGATLLTAALALGDVEVASSLLWVMGVTGAALMLIGLLLLAIPFCGRIRRHKRDPRVRPPERAPSTPNDALREALAAATKTGRRLHAEAGELNPIGNLDRLDDLVRRYNAWEGSVADALADDDDVPSEWRDLWLRDPEWHNSAVYPYTREQLDRMVRLIGYRLQLIDGMRRDLRRRGQS
jgi:hypothetical protein